jgi:hypothetical protein
VSFGMRQRFSVVETEEHRCGCGLWGFWSVLWNGFSNKMLISTEKREKMLDTQSPYEKNVGCLNKHSK